MKNHTGSMWCFSGASIKSTPIRFGGGPSSRDPCGFVSMLPAYPENDSDGYNPPSARGMRPPLPKDILQHQEEHKRHGRPEDRTLGEGQVTFARQFGGPVDQTGE